MKVLYTTKDGRLRVELEADTQVDLFRQLSEFQEVFEDRTCRKNGKESDDVRFVVRMDEDENEYFEYKVASGPLRGTKKAFGQTKKGGKLFPKRKDKDDNWLPDDGWVRWDKDLQKEV